MTKETNEVDFWPNWKSVINTKEKLYVTVEIKQSKNSNKCLSQLLLSPICATEHFVIHALCLYTHAHSRSELVGIYACLHAKLLQLCLTLLWLYRLAPAKFLCSWYFPGKDTGVGCHALLQKIFPNQRWNLSLFCLLHWQEFVCLFVFVFSPGEQPGKPMVIYKSRNSCCSHFLVSLSGRFNSFKASDKL